MLFFLVAGHALADFGLQSDAMAQCKCRRARLPLQKAVPWYYWMAAHVLIQGGMVGVVLRFSGYDAATAVAYGLLETVVHWFADIAKCEGYTGIHADQAVHVGCKVAWAVMLANGLVWPASWPQGITF